MIEEFLIITTKEKLIHCGGQNDIEPVVSAPVGVNCGPGCKQESHYGSHHFCTQSVPSTKMRYCECEFNTDKNSDNKVIHHYFDTRKVAMGGYNRCPYCRENCYK